LNLVDFCDSIPSFHDLKKSEKIDLIAYFLIKIKKQSEFNTSDINESFTLLREVPYSNIPQYLKQNSDQIKSRKKVYKFLHNNKSYILSRKFENEIGKKIHITNSSFFEFEVDTNKLDWNPNDIPFLNNSIKKNAHFFTKLYYLFYHLENSIRKFLTNRLTSILGNNWQNALVDNVDLRKAQSIKNEVDLTNMLPDRGDNILFYCMWDDYAEIMSQYPQIFKHKKEATEIIAHLGTLTKIRNAIAHNVSTIPKEYQNELTIFLSKFIKILNKNES
jgi:hypothetical protein